ADQGYNLLRLKGLPPAPPQHVYRLWAEVDGRQVGCVQFVPDNDGVVAMPIPSEPSSHASRLSISLEPLRPGGDQ
ncbi:MULTISPECIES: anti-sigma factor, partial [Aphanothece]|uniref:anti-sigma factor n=1 Tax=Aphanothece TaxID=1121 RepID=UPI003984F6F6